MGLSRKLIHVVSRIRVFCSHTQAVTHAHTYAHIGIEFRHRV